MPSALIIGATGITGSFILKELLNSSYWTTVGEYGRRVTDPSTITSGKEKLEQKQIDFENLGEAKLGEGKWDVVFITISTTRKTAGSAAAWQKVDKDYVISAARAARWESPTQRVVYLSAAGANPLSSIFYLRSKGETEQALANLGYSDTIAFRPTLLAGAKREKIRLAETVLGYITPVLSFFSSNMEIQVSALGKSMERAGRLGTVGLPGGVDATTVGNEGGKYTAISNAGAVTLSKLPDV